MGIKNIQKAMHNLKKLYEKNAKPIYFKSENETIPRCPRCHHALLLKEDEEKCKECGKEIDWS